MTLPADGDLRIDEVLRNTYRIVSLLGRGGMGSVYLAQHLRLPGKQVAVKVLRGGDHLTPEIFARFRREAEIASRLGHPNIVEVLDYDTLENGNPFLVLEYLRGESLQERLERGRLPMEDVVSFTRQMGSALQAAHGAGVIHRDLKPANVFLVPTDSGGVVGERVKLLDFGISKVLSSTTVQTQEATIIGTPQYMSPEQAQGKNRDIDARTDVFALGCIVYEMMAGKPVFGSGSLAQMIFRVVYEPPEPLAPLCPEATPEAISAVMRALAKGVDERYPDVSSFIADLTGTPLHSLSTTAGNQPAPRPQA
ncbi:serine/threonine-protein kinase, partial [Myxococcus sp. CA006]